MNKHLDELLLVNFIYGNLSDYVKTKVVSHLASCKTCRNNLALYIKVSNPAISHKEKRMLAKIFPESTADYAHQILNVLKNYHKAREKSKWEKAYESVKVRLDDFFFAFSLMLKQKRIAIPSIVGLILLILFIINPIGRYNDYRAVALINAGNDLLIKNVRPYYTLPLRAYGFFPCTEFRVLRGKIPEDIKSQSESLKKYFEKAVDLRKKNPEVLSSAGNFYLVAGNFKSARLLFRKALEIHPDNATAANGMGILAFKESKFELAISYFSQAKKANPNFIEARYNLAFLYKIVGKNQKAKRELLEYLNMDSSSEWATNVRLMLKDIQ